MASLASTLVSPHIRPFRAWRDGHAVSRLLELCFNEGESSRSSLFSLEGVMQQLERWVQGPFLPGGYIWEEDGKVVGNVSLIRLNYQGRSIVLIANVAVHPDFRRRGIAHALMEQAIQSAREQQGGEIWLQVRAENEGALRLYMQLKFTTQARRTVWYAKTTSQIPASFAFQARALPRSLWPLVRQWLERLHPSYLGWYHDWDWDQARPGWEMTLWRWILGIQSFQWISIGSGPQAALLWFPSMRSEIGLWLAYPPNPLSEAVIPLLWMARRRLYPSRHALYLEHPQGEMDEALCAAGFSPIRTLLWMRL